MPSRVLRDHTDSFRFEHLSAEAERLFHRLIMKADDYGRYSADPRLIRSGCFPLLPSISDDDISSWLDACRKAGLIAVYEVQGRSYLAIINFRQRMRQMKGKFPPPSGQAPDWQPDDTQPIDGQLTVNCPSDDGLSRRDTISKGYDNEGEDGDKSPGPAAVLVEAWNGLGLPQVVKLTSGRLKSVNARMSEPFFRENYSRGLEMVRESKFCNGGNDRAWKADFDWFVKPDTLARVLENKYEDRKPKRDPVTGRSLR